MPATHADELAYQRRILPAVSRTFALTIPRLPERLQAVVGTLYLLCRIADTIEDEPALGIEDKRLLANWYVAALGGIAPAASFAERAHALLGRGTPEAERDLVANAPRVIRLASRTRPSPPGRSSTA